MSDATQRGGPRLPPPKNRARPRWILALPLAVVLGVVIGMSTSSVPRFFAPPSGPPDTLRELRVALPTAPVLPQTRYLTRAVTRESARDRQIRDLAERYNITLPFSRTIYAIAEEVGIDPELGYRLIRVESVFDPEARNPGGALGLTQLMPSTARDLDPSMKTTKQIMEPRTNMRLGFTNLRNMLELFDGDVRLAVIAYNRGEVAVQRAVKRGKDPENGYGKLVLGPTAHGGTAYTGPGLRPTPASAAADAAKKAAKAAAEAEDGED